MRKSIGDLHCHPSLKPVNNSSNKIKDIWTYKKNITTKALFKGFFKLKNRDRRWAINLFVRDIATFTQSNLDSCYEGNNRLLFLSIYPIERQFLKPDRPFRSSNIVQRLILNRIFDKNLNRSVDNKIIRILTGFSKSKVSYYLKTVYDSEYVDYFNTDLMDEYKYIESSHLSSSVNPNNFNKPSFKLISNYEEYKNTLEDNIVAGIVTVEGMHALGKYKTKNLFESESIDSLSPNEQQELKDSFKKNIELLKNKKNFKFTPFFITFSHHFNNLISGHAKSFADSKKGILPGFSNVFNQKIGLDLGISAFGKDLIENYLLSRSNGSRILIDTKHMSLESRNDFVEIVENLRKDGDNVPIIISHTAINGILTRDDASVSKDINQLDEKSYVSRWDINITDQDISEVFESDGIIGVCMHDGRMPGGKFVKLYKGFKRGFKQDESLNRLHTQMFLTNVFHIVKVNLKHIRTHNINFPNNLISEIDAWKTICLGSDNDGIVDPFDNFSTASTLDDFKHRVMKAIGYNFKPFWKDFRILSIDENSFSFFDKEELFVLMLGLTPSEISDRIFCDNIELFLSKYFTDKYLSGDN